MTSNWIILITAAIVCLGLVGVMVGISVVASRRKHPASEWIWTAALMLGIPLLAIPLFVAFLWFGLVRIPTLTGEGRAPTEANQEAGNFPEGLGQFGPP